VRAWTDKIKSVERGSRYLVVGLVVLAAALLVAGRWDLSLAVGAGGLLGWVMKDPVRITWAIFVVAFTIPVSIDFGYPTNPSYTLLLLLFILAVRGRMLRAGRDGWQPTLIATALLLPLTALLAGVVHWHGIKPIIVGISPLLCIGVLCWHLIEEARRDPQLTRRIAQAFTWLSVAVAVLAKYQSLSGTWPVFDQLAYDPIYTSLFDPTRSVGISGHPIIYGTFAMAMALVALTIRGRFWYVPFTANLVGLALSGTRSALVGILLALALWLFSQWRISRWRTVTWRGMASTIAIVATAFMIVAVKPSTFSFPSTDSAPTPNSSTPAPDSSAPAPDSSAPAPNSVDSLQVARSRISNPMESDSANARFTRLGTVWHGITEDWSTVVFGHGPEADVRYLLHTGIHDGQAQVFDNTYLSFWYNFGLIGVTCLLLIMVAVYRRLRSLPPRVLFIAFAAQIFFFDVWLWLAATAVFLLAVTLGAAANPTWSPQPLHTPALAKRRTRAADGIGEKDVAAVHPG
jgi:hypothetical protein